MERPPDTGFDRPREAPPGAQLSKDGSGGPPRHDGQMLRWLLSYMARHKGAAATVYLLMVATALLGSAVLPITETLLAGVSGLSDPQNFAERLTRTTVGSFFAGESAIQVVSQTGGLLLFFHVLAGVLSYASVYAMDVFSGRVGKDMRSDLFYKIIRMRDDFFQEHPVGELMSRFTQDLNSAISLYNAVFFSPVLSLMMVIATAITVLIIQPALGLAVLFTAPIFWLVIGPMSKAIQARVRAVATNFVAVNEDLQETLSAAREVKAHSAEGREDQEFRDVLERQYGGQLAYSRYQTLASQSMKSLSSILPVAMLVAGAFYVVYHPSVQAAVLVTMYTAVPPLLGALMSLSSVKLAYNSGMVYGQNVYDLLHQPLESESIPGTQELQIPADWDPALPVIEFDNVFFSYPKTGYSVRKISFKIFQGQSVAIVGAGGSGKTTILSILFKLYPYGGGSVKIYGQELRELSIASVRSHIGFMMQFPFFFQRSVLENVLYGTDERGPQMDERAKQLCRDFDMDSVVSAMNQGYETVVTGRGANFSGSQQKRLALARALMRDPAFVVLDEPLSGLAADQTKEVIDKISLLKGKKVVLMITHDLDRLQHVDQILVFTRLKAEPPMAAVAPKMDGAVMDQAALELLAKAGGISDGPPKGMPKGDMPMKKMGDMPVKMGMAMAMGAPMPPKEYGKGGETPLMLPPRMGGQEYGTIGEQGTYAELAESGTIFPKLLASRAN